MLLHQIVVFLLAAVLTVPLLRRLGLGNVLGYLMAGVAIGPWGLDIARDVQAILHFGEIGVVFLLFVIGLELQPARLRAMRRAVFGPGIAQVLISALVLTVLAAAFGLDGRAALAMGFVLIRETFLSSLHLGGRVLEGLGLSPREAGNATTLFHEHDERTLASQRAIREEREALIQSTKEAARELKELFEADAESRRGEYLPRRKRGQKAAYAN